MIIAAFENGNSRNAVKFCYTQDYVTVEQTRGGEFVIKNSIGETLMSNFHSADNACKFGLEISAKYTLPLENRLAAMGEMPYEC